MTVSSSYTDKVYSINGSTTTFAWGQDLDTQYGSLVVTEETASTGGNVVTTYVEGTDYEVVNKDVVFYTAPSDTTHYIHITRNTYKGQPVEFIEGEDFPAEDFEHSLDRLAMIAQEQAKGLEDETSARIAADTALNDKITAETNRAKGVEGSLTDLTTTNKTNLVGAINEINGRVKDIISVKQTVSFGIGESSVEISMSSLVEDTVTYYPVVCFNEDNVSYMSNVAIYYTMNKKLKLTRSSTSTGVSFNAYICLIPTTSTEASMKGVTNGQWVTSTKNLYYTKTEANASTDGTINLDGAGSGTKYIYKADNPATTLETGKKRVIINLTSNFDENDDGFYIYYVSIAGVISNLEKVDSYKTSSNDKRKIVLDFDSSLSYAGIAAWVTAVPLGDDSVFDSNRDRQPVFIIDKDSYGQSYMPWTKIAQSLNGKQDALVSGTNIKTINNNSILGSGNIDISGGGSNSLLIEGTFSFSENLNSAYIDVTSSVESLVGYYPVAYIPDNRKKKISANASYVMYTDGTRRLELKRDSTDVASTLSVNAKICLIPTDYVYPEETTVEIKGITNGQYVAENYSRYINKTSIASSVDNTSTNSEVVGAKLFYDTCGDITSLINAL